MQKHSPAPAAPASARTNNQQQQLSASSSSQSSIAAANLIVTNAATPLTAALVKEYLASRGLNKTLDAFKLEFLQFQLADQLGITKLIKQNKAQDHPLKTHLEIITKYLLSRSQKQQPLLLPSGPPSATTTPPSSRPGTTATMDATVNQAPTLRPGTGKQGLDAPSEIVFKTPLGGFVAGNPRAVASAGVGKGGRGVSAKLGKDGGKKGSAGGKRGEEGVVGEGEEVWEGGFRKSDKHRPVVLENGEDGGASARGGGSATRAGKVNNDVEIMEDFDDDEYSLTSDVGGSLVVGKVGGGGGGGMDAVGGGVLISTRDAWLLRRLVFPGTLTGGDESRARMGFTEEWKGKGFCFGTNAEVAYGLVQIKGGPCGLLASVQAYVLKHLLFVEKAHNIRNGKLRPGLTQCQTALVDALTEILWQAGGTRHRRAVVAIYNPNLRATSSTTAHAHREKYVPDGITENMQLFEFFDVNLLKAFVASRLATFAVNDPNRHGLIQLLYSVILSRGTETIRDEDFDEVECSMIGRHGYCTQEMVNLILMGQAVSNVHDGDFQLGEGADVKVLKGIKKQCQFGYLSLFEHYGSLKVGDYYKTPVLPIFVVCSESHFTCLFSLDKEILFKTGHATRLQDKLELFYYDGLANQDNEISLDIVLGAGGKGRKIGSAGSSGVSSGENGVEENGGLEPPLELVLKTRWREVSRVVWRGSDPLL
ncbi:hypothetical protein HDU98_006523 [Podochytrium sp. JEL0797]|nr:hypothetical protein HDU98_006523 [Podochytrium sp. JEL0797]